MGFFKRTLRFAKNVAMTPVDAVVDVATAGIRCEDEMPYDSDPRTVERLRKLADEVREAAKWLDKD
jgi:hypothetical protein